MKEIKEKINIKGFERAKQKLKCKNISKILEDKNWEYLNLQKSCNESVKQGNKRIIWEIILVELNNINQICKIDYLIRHSFKL